MADDRPPQSVDQFASTETPADQDETNWGEDWESAFQAEDDAFFSSEKDEDFFLEENEPTVTAGVAAQELDSSLEKTLAGIPDQGSASGIHPAKAIFDIGALTALFLTGKIFKFSRNFKTKFRRRTNFRNQIKNCGGAGSKMGMPSARLKGVGVQPDNMSKERGDAATRNTTRQPNISFLI